MLGCEKRGCEKKVMVSEIEDVIMRGDAKMDGEKIIIARRGDVRRKRKRKKRPLPWFTALLEEVEYEREN